MGGLRDAAAGLLERMSEHAKMPVGLSVLVACLFLLLLAAGGLVTSIRATSEGFREVGTLEEARRHSEFLLSLLKDVETGQRGFAVAGDPVFLEPYDSALPRIGPELDILRPSLSEAENRRLRSLVGEMLDASARSVALARTGLDAARSSVLQGEGKRIMDRIRTEVAAIARRIETELDQVEQRARNRSLTSSVLALLACALAWIITGAAAWIIRRRSESQITLAEEQREEAVAVSKRSETILRESEEHHRNIIELNPQVLWTAGPDGRILDFNERWLSLTGLSREEALGEGWAQAPHPDDLPGMADAWTRSVQTGRPYDVEHRIRLADGAYRWMRSRAVARRDGAGAIVRWYGTTEDIHDRRMAELQRAELHGELLHATRVSTMGEVAGALAHELNQPLGALLNYVDGCRVMLGTGSGAVPAPVLTALDHAHEQAVRAGDIVRRLRQYLAKARGERRLCDINTLIHEAARLGIGRADRAGIRVVWRLAPTLPPVSADPVEIQQVIVNLLRNAVEAMEHGRERRELSIATRAGENGTVETTVADTGPGIDDTVAPTLFKSFVTTKPNGMGLGLSICRSIISAHGGSITAEPNPGGGTLFRFTLPAAIPEEEKQNA